MEIKDFKDLTGFIYDEYERLTETFGLDKTPKKSIRFAEKSVRKYSKLYSKPLFKKEKRKLKLELANDKRQDRLKVAFDTMPHGFLWRIFHFKLWKRMQYVLENEKESESAAEEKSDVVPDICVPAVIVEKEIIDVTDHFNEDFE